MPGSFWQAIAVNDIEQFTLGLAREAGQLVRRERAQADLNHSYKQGNELVTHADLMADRFISEAIRGRYPESGIISEESAPEVGNLQSRTEPLWIVDPIDGTVNYAHGHSQSAVSIAYAEAGQILFGAVYNPFTDEMFHARAGGGARLNGEPIRVAGETDLRRAIIATGFPYRKAGIDAMVERLRRILKDCADVRRLGSAALDICWVAAGRLDGYYESLSLWDFAAARLIALEAGATCGHFSELPEGADPQFYTQNLLIANPALFPLLRALLRDEVTD